MRRENRQRTSETYPDISNSKELWLCKPQFFFIVQLY